jgi:hypothetical protein
LRGTKQSTNTDAFFGRTALLEQIIVDNFWRDINGEPVHAPLEDALIHFPQPVYFEVKKTPLIAVDYALWKEKILAFQA